LPRPTSPRCWGTISSVCSKRCGVERTARQILPAFRRAARARWLHSSRSGRDVPPQATPRFVRDPGT
jgi:hypothetical protein